MKSNIIILLFTLYSFSLYAQNSGDKPQKNFEIDELEINNAPSLMLLDEAPTIMDRKNGGSAFVFSQFNTSNFAASVTPFWFLLGGDHWTSKRFAGVSDKKKKNGKYKMNPFVGLKYATFSAAYVDEENKTLDKTFNHFSFGGHTNILTIHPPNHAEEIIKSEELIRNNMEGYNGYLMRKYYKSIYDFFNDDGKTNDSILKLQRSSFDYDKYSKDISEELLDEFDDLSKLIAQKPYLSIDGAAGYSFFYLDNNYDQNYFGRFGAWLTALGSVPFGGALGQRSKYDSYLNFSGLLRYISDGLVYNNVEEKFGKQSYFDLGVKAEVELNRLSFGYEYVSRAAKYDSLDSYRSSVVVQYRVSSDIYITGAFGKKFGIQNDNLLALFGLNWAFLTKKQNISIFKD